MGSSYLIMKVLNNAKPKSSKAGVQPVVKCTGTSESAVPGADGMFILPTILKLRSIIEIR
jgi:hypothetical protein